MDLVDILQTVGVVGAAGIIVVGALGAGYIYGRFTRRIEDAVTYPRGIVNRPSVPAIKSEVEDGVQLRSVKEAITFGPDTRSIVKGVVDFWTPASDGYVGNLRDDSGKAPFYVCEDNINPLDGKWVVPLLLEHSLRNKQLITMEVGSPDGLPILIVRGINYTIDGQKYDI